MTMEDLRVKLLYTSVIYFLFLQLALRYGICGPTLSDLKENLAVDTNSVSRSVSIMSAGICLGAISTGIFCKLMSKELLAFILVLVTSFLMGTITFLRSYAFFLVWNFLLGVSSGGAISLCESWILELWGSKCGPYMNALQFFRGLGYIIAPVLVDPFLLPNEDDVDNGNVRLSSNLTDPINVTIANQTLTEEARYNTKIHTPYILNATMLAVGATFLLGLYIYKFISRKASTNLAQGVSQIEILSTSNISISELKRVQAVLEQDKKGGQGKGVDLNQRAKYFGFAIVFLSSVFYLFFYEEAIVIFLPTFATNLKVRLSKSQASLLTMAFSLANVIGKAISVLLALKVSHVKLLYGNLVIMIGSLIIIILFGNANLPLLWVGICLHGIGLSSVIASLYSFLESQVKITPLICGILNMTGTMGSVFMPLVIGHHLDEFPMALMFACLTCAVICLLIYGTVHALICNKNLIIPVTETVNDQSSFKSEKKINHEKVAN